MHPGVEDRESARSNCTRNEGAIVVEGEITVYTTTHWQSIPSPFRCLDKLIWVRVYMLNKKKKKNWLLPQQIVDAISQSSFPSRNSPRATRFRQNPLKTPYSPSHEE